MAPKNSVQHQTLAGEHRHSHHRIVDAFVAPTQRPTILHDPSSPAQKPHIMEQWQSESHGGARVVEDDERKCKGLKR